MYHLFDVHGVELEYMLVDRESFDVSPVVPEILKAIAGDYVNDFVDGPIGLGNELVSHVIELRHADPAPSLLGQGKLFQDAIHRINKVAAQYGACVLSSAAHPWMDPEKDTVLWQHENKEIYEHFHAIFNCRRHGWANLQSCQLNLPFGNEEEFGRLHAAIRFLLPLLPALASSSPVLNLQISGLMNNRLKHYKTNAERVPEVSGDCIPEPVWTFRDYQTEILEKAYKAMRSHDPEGILCHEWINARGAIARFDRNAIEIRILDMQETPKVDIAICWLITKVLKRLCDPRRTDQNMMRSWRTDKLVGMLDDCIQYAGETKIDPEYLRVFDKYSSETIMAKDLWADLLQDDAEQQDEGYREFQNIVQNILDKGVLSKRILNRLQGDFRKEAVREILKDLANCAESGNIFK